MFPPERYEWSIAVFCVNEGKTILECLKSIAHSVGMRSAKITVLLNGSTDDSNDRVKCFDPPRNITVDLRIFPRADKADMINHALYQLRANAEAYFFIDAYTRVSHAALEAMAEELRRNPHASIVTGVQMNGRSRDRVTQATLKGGAVNGQLYALQPRFVERLIERGIKLPRNLYRGDGLLGSMACHDLEPKQTEWDSSRVVGLSEAGFYIHPLAIWKIQDIKRQLNREIRQARGKLENAAIQSIIYKNGYEALPDDADDMIMDFLARQQVKPASLKERYFTRVARQRVWSNKRSLDHTSMAR